LNRTGKDATDHYDIAKVFAGEKKGHVTGRGGLGVKVTKEASHRHVEKKSRGGRLNETVRGNAGRALPELIEHFDGFLTAGR